MTGIPADQLSRFTEFLHQIELRVGIHFPASRHESVHRNSLKTPPLTTCPAQ